MQPDHPTPEHGVITLVETRHPGTETTLQVNPGDQTLTVVDVQDFPETRTLELGGDEYDYDQVVGLDDLDGTATAETIHLTMPATATYPAGTPVLVCPVQSYKVAWVLTDTPDGSDPADPDEYFIPHHYQPLLKEGPRQTGEGEDVTVADVDGRLEIVDVTGRTALFDAAHLDPASTPPGETIANAFRNHSAELVGAVDPSHIAPGPLPPGVRIGAFVGDEDGTKVIDDAGNVRAVIPTDGRNPQWSGDADLDTLATTTAARLGGTTQIGVGAQVGLSAATTTPPPPVPPRGATDWDTVTLRLDSEPHDRLGLAVASTTVAYTLDLSDGRRRLVTFNPADGTQTAVTELSGTPTPTTTWTLAWSGNATLIHTLEYDQAARRWVRRSYNPTTGAYSTQTVVTELGHQETPRPAMSCLTALGHEYVTIARSNGSAGTCTMWVYTDGTLTSTITTEPVDLTGDLAAVATLGGTRVLTGTTNPVFPDGPAQPAGFAGKPYADRPLMPVVNVSFFGSPGQLLGWGVVGNRDLQTAGVACLDGATNLFTWYLSATADQLLVHSNYFEAGHYWVAVSGYDSANGEETLISPPVRLRKIPGAILRVSINPYGQDQGVDSIRVYMGRETTDNTYPGNPAMYAQGISVPGMFSLDVLSVATSGANPLAVPTKGATGTPGALVNQDDAVVLVDAHYTGWLVDVDGGTA